MRIQLRTFTIFWARRPTKSAAGEPRFAQDVIVIDVEDGITGIFRDASLSRFEADTAIENVVNYYAAEEEERVLDPTLN